MALLLAKLTSRRLCGEGAQKRRLVSLFGDKVCTIISRIARCCSASTGKSQDTAGEFIAPRASSARAFRFESSKPQRHRWCYIGEAPSSWTSCLVEAIMVKLAVQMVAPLQLLGRLCSFSCFTGGVWTSALLPERFVHCMQHHRQDHETATLVWDGEQLLLRGSATRRNACHAGGSSPRVVCLAEATHREVSPSGRARV